MAGSQEVRLKSCKENYRALAGGDPDMHCQYIRVYAMFGGRFERKHGKRAVDLTLFLFWRGSISRSRCLWG